MQGRAARLFGPGKFIRPDDGVASARLENQRYRRTSSRLWRTHGTTNWIRKTRQGKKGAQIYRKMAEYAGRHRPDWGARGSVHRRERAKPGGERGGGSGAGSLSVRIVSERNGNTDGTLTRAALKTRSAKWFAEWDSRQERQVNEDNFAKG